MKPMLHNAASHRQRGAATLIVVMILFFVMSLAAAYTNRSLIFEQRTSANQYRSTQSLEVADAGMEWAISQLNYSRIDAACAKSAVATDTSFRRRYLNINAATGNITPVANLAGGDLTALCVWTNTAWNCDCPTTGLPAVVAPTTPGPKPAFRVRFRAVSLPAVTPSQPSAIWVDVVGCTRLGLGASDPCLSFTGLGALNEGRTVVTSMVSLAGNAAGLPLAAVTARGAINLGTSALTAYNTVSGGSGIALQSGGAIAGAAMVLRGAPGTPAAASTIDFDPALGSAVGQGLAAATPYTTEDRMFTAVFKGRPTAFQNQQGVVELTCPLSGCTAATVRAAVAFNPGRPLWLTGALIVDSAGDIGSAAEPVLMVVNGDLQHTASGAAIYGLVYVRMAGAAVNWNVSGSGQISGAVVTDGGVRSTVASGPTVVYDPNVLNLVRFNVGSFVRVPGSWRDFQ